jgi:hypothetical protein
LTRFLAEGFYYNKSTLFCIGFSSSGYIYFQQVAIDPELPSEDITAPSVPNNITSFFPMSLEALPLDDSFVDSVPVSVKSVTKCKVSRK